jgi:hypothetical protein
MDGNMKGFKFDLDFSVVTCRFQPQTTPSAYWTTKTADNLSTGVEPLASLKQSKLVEMTQGEIRTVKSAREPQPS